MRNTEIVKGFGESFAAYLFYKMGYEVDFLDAEGIDLACYKKDESGISYGVSVKTRNIKPKGDESTKDNNHSFNIKYNDIVYTYEQSEIRHLEPAYALVVADLKKIDVLIVTQEYAFKKLFNVRFDAPTIANIDDYKKRYTSKNDNGAERHISIAQSSRKLWKERKDDEGVIFTASYSSE